jgi:succinate-acetate transporter protein
MSEAANKKPNAGPVGLLVFGMTTVLLNLHNAGITELSVVIVAMGFAFGGAAQIIAGVLEFRSGKTFGGTAFCAYGWFWWSLCLIWISPFGNIAPADEKTMGFYLMLWGVFTLFMFIGTLAHNRATQTVFLTLTVLFFLLAIADWTGSRPLKIIAGIEGIVCGLSAIYSALGQIVNGELKKTIFPL